MSVAELGPTEAPFEVFRGDAAILPFNGSIDRQQRAAQVIFGAEVYGATLADCTVEQLGIVLCRVTSVYAECQSPDHPLADDSCSPEKARDRVDQLELHWQGKTDAQIAKQFGFSYTQSIGRLRRKTYRQLGAIVDELGPDAFVADVQELASDAAPVKTIAPTRKVESDTEDMSVRRKAALRFEEVFAVSRQDWASDVECAAERFTFELAVANDSYARDAAINICARCPVLKDCLIDALGYEMSEDHKIVYVRAGITEQKRRQLQDKIRARLKKGDASGARTLLSRAIDAVYY